MFVCSSGSLLLRFYALLQVVVYILVLALAVVFAMPVTILETIPGSVRQSLYLGDWGSQRNMGRCLVL